MPVLPVILFSVLLSGALWGQEQEPGNQEPGSQPVAADRIMPTPAVEQPSPVPLTVGQKLGLHASKLVHPINIGRSAVSSAMDHALNDPPEWGQGMAGYGRRYGSKVGQRAVRSALSFGTDSLLGLDPRYYRAPEKTVWGRVKNAVGQTVRTRTDGGAWTFNASNFAAAYGGSAISNLWRPPSERTWSQTVQRGTFSLGIDASMNLFNEFWPDIKSRIFRRKK
jgi:hypothetical protein